MRILTAALGLAVLVSAGAARADVTVEHATKLPASATATLAATGCENSGGPYIELAGDLSFGQFKAKLVFSNKRLTDPEAAVKGAHTADELVDVDVVLSDLKRTEFRKGGSDGVGGNPHILVGLEEPKSCELYTPLFYLGRCNQPEPKTIASSFWLPALAKVTISGCDHTGPYITIDGGLTIGGVNGRVLLQNNVDENGQLKGNGNNHQQSTDGELSLVLSPEETIQIRKGQGGPGGNPHMYVGLSNSDGSYAWHYIGRCNGKSR